MIMASALVKAGIHVPRRCLSCGTRVGAQQPLAVQVRLAADRVVVDAQQPGGGAAQVAAQSGLALQTADELIPAPGAPGVAALDEPAQMLDEGGPYRGVTLGGGRVVADDEPLGA